MIYETDIYSIEYDAKSEKLVQSMNEALSQNFQRILDFWGIEKLANHVNIKIYSEMDDWIKFYEEKSGSKYQDYVVGCADGPNIYVLAFDEYKKTQQHKNDSLEDFQKIVRQLVEKVPHEKIIEYALDATKLYEDWNELEIKD